MSAIFFTNSTASAENISTWSPAEGTELIGSAAPEFKNLEWLNHTPITMRELRGKVVLIRFWLAGCPLCENTAPALNHLYEKYGARGLMVIGVHHAKSEETKKSDVVVSAAEKLGFKFPIAQDTDWSTINSYWLGKTKRKFTSATILIDKQGSICWVHDGGIIAMNGTEHAAFDSLSEKIESELARH
ncbi:MAG TPA: redoxin domain-containing protein [Drouetiella sp.]